MTAIILTVLGAVAGWFAADKGVIRMKPPTAALAGGLGALVGGAMLQLLLNILGAILGAAIGVALALVLAQAAFGRR
ncbi:MAG: hypothetical protein KTR21_07295 [Rhodobacteraceae bacterium]|nr:hypothetical protein [Paracoccaceae bacterium]